MNLSANPTKPQLAELLAKCDDKATPHILWVDHDGEVHITPLPLGVVPVDFGERPDLRFRYETFHTGHDYTGPDAAADVEFVDDLFTALVRDWKEGLTGYSDDWNAR